MITKSYVGFFNILYQIIQNINNPQLICNYSLNEKYSLESLNELYKLLIEFNSKHLIFCNIIIKKNCIYLIKNKTKHQIKFLHLNFNFESKENVNT